MNSNYNESDKSINIFTSLVVAVPSSQFEFELSNTTVGQLDVKKSSVLGINIGYTRVTLVDKRILCLDLYSKSVLGVFDWNYNKTISRQEAC